MTDLASILTAHPVTVDDHGRRCGCAPDAVRHTGDDPESEAHFVRLHAEHVAGVVRDTRTIRTVEDLKALPVRSIVYSHDDPGLVWQRQSVMPDGHDWLVTADAFRRHPRGISLPARVLWHPEWDGGSDD